MPIRTSIVTGKKYEDSVLQRFTVQAGVVVFDKDVKNEGRGGYVEKDPEKMARLKKLKGKIKYWLKAPDIKAFEDY